MPIRQGKKWDGLSSSEDTVTTVPTGTQDVNVTNTVTITGTATSLPSGTQDVAEVHIGLNGTSHSGVVALTTTGTWFSVPSAAMTVSHQLEWQVRGAGNFYKDFSSTSTAGESGVLLTDKDYGVVVFGPSKVLYFSSDVTSSSVYWIAKEVTA